jgi:hypothetical protein
MSANVNSNRKEHTYETSTKAVYNNVTISNIQASREVTIYVPTHYAKMCPFAIWSNMYFQQ